MIQKGTSEGSYILTSARSFTDWEITRNNIGPLIFTDEELRSLFKIVDNLTDIQFVSGIRFSSRSNNVVQIFQDVEPYAFRELEKQDLLDAITIALGEPYVCPV